MDGLRDRRAALARAARARSAATTSRQRRFRSSSFRDDGRRDARRARRRGSRSPASSGYEIWVPAAIDQVALYDASWPRARDLGSAHFGARALHSLRLEKSFGNWAREYRPIYTPAEAGLDRFVDVDKATSSDARRSCARSANGPGAAPRSRSSSMPADADAIGDEPVWHDGKVVGWVTSGGYGHCVGKSIALRLRAVPRPAIPDARFEIEILGERRDGDAGIEAASTIQQARGCGASVAAGPDAIEGKSADARSPKALGVPAGGLPARIGTNAS
mgnify:CR=1 FL=1